MDAKTLCAWLDERIADAREQLNRTTDKITVANLAGMIQVWEAVQVKVVRS